MSSIPGFIFVIFNSLNLVIFGLKAYLHWVSCDRNSSYVFYLHILSFAAVSSRPEDVHVIGCNMFFYSTRFFL